MKATLARIIGRRSVLSALSLALLTAGLVIVGGSPANAEIGINDYPTSIAGCHHPPGGGTSYTCDLKDDTQDSDVDPWSFYNRECTSFVAWRMNHDNGVAFSDTMTVNGHTATWGNAYQWHDAAVTLGYAYNSTPARGSVAWWDAGYHGASSSGHVAYVDQVTYNPDGSVASIGTEDYNAANTGAYATHTITVGSTSGPGWPSGFIHIADINTVTRGSDDGPAAVSWGSGRVDIFARGSTGDLIHKAYDGSTGWTDWESLGGGILGSPTAVSLGSGYIDVFVRGTDNQLYEKTFALGVGWSSWVALGGNLASSPAAVAWDSTRIDIFARGPAGDEDHTYWTSSGGWSGSWESLGGGVLNSPTAVSWGSGQLDVFVEGTDNHLYQKHYDTTNGWGAWTAPIGGTLGGSPGAVSWASGRTDVFVRGTAADLDHTFYASGAWSTSWESLGGGMIGPPTAVSWNSGRIDVFVRGTDNHLYQKEYLSSSGWSSWVNLGGDLY